MVKFIELKTDDEYSEAFHILKELDGRLKPDRFLSAMHHELSYNTKLFAIRDSGRIVSVAAVWFLMTGLFEKILWIHAFVTSKEQRSKGFGKLLLSGLYKVAIENDCAEIRVHAHREKAIRFWTHNAGFHTFSTILRKNDFA
jgi:GNAT superfamily N-acetyltransferase